MCISFIKNEICIFFGPGSTILNPLFGRADFNAQNILKKHMLHGNSNYQAAY